MSGPPVSVGFWLAAAIPVALLFLLVASGKVRSQTAAGVVLAVTMLVAWLVFRAGWRVELIALGKGLWLGTWILLVVWPALLLYRMASAAGLERIGGSLAGLLPNRCDTLLLLAWVFPGFIQGVAGFGTPIAVCAPLLLAMGWSPTKAVIYPLIGYHWAVTFGSMGSSFYMASLTAHLDVPEQARFALVAAGFLAVNMLLAGAAVLALDGGWDGLRDGWPVMVTVGIPMAATLMVTAVVVPAVASLAAGAVGLVVMTLRARLLRRPGLYAGVDATAGSPYAGGGTAVREERLHQTALLLSPYFYLLATALPVFLFPAARAWIRNHLVLAFHFPGSRTGRGWINEAVADYTPLAVFQHPGFYVLSACVLGYVTYRRAGLWNAGAGWEVVKGWGQSLPRASTSILLLAAVATLLVDSGMVSTLARGLTAVTGEFYPALSPWVGAAGSFMTGSTTTSNALFAGLQREASEVLGMGPAVLLAAQTAGANVGNAIAPVVILVGATAVDDLRSVPVILRVAIVPATLILLWLSLLTSTLSTWSS